MNDRVMKGALSSIPAFSHIRQSLYIPWLFQTRPCLSSARPQAGEGFALSRCRCSQASPVLDDQVYCLAYSRSVAPTATMLCESCATEEAKAPVFRPKFLMNPSEGRVSLYLLTTAIFKMSLCGSDTAFPLSIFGFSRTHSVTILPSSAAMMFIEDPWLPRRKSVTFFIRA